MRTMVGLEWAIGLGLARSLHIYAYNTDLSRKPARLRAVWALNLQLNGSVIVGQARRLPISQLIPKELMRMMAGPEWAIGLGVGGSLPVDIDHSKTPARTFAGLI